MKKAKENNHGGGRTDSKAIALSMHIKYAQWRQIAHSRVLV